MSTTLGTELTNLGIDLDDPNNDYFTTADLTLWINQAQLDMARRGEALMDQEIINCAANVASYPLPSDTIRAHHIYFSPNDPTQLYPLIMKGRQEMDGIWWVNQTTPATYPLYYTTWQQPPFIMVQVYPVPAQYGTLICYYYRLPVSVVNSGDIIDIPDGYEDTLRSYVRYCARRRAGDPMWQDDKAIYEEGLATLITNSRSWTDNAGQFAYQPGAFVPGWLYGGFGS